jgi:tagatose 1,6-diphosphate aldolase
VFFDRFHFVDPGPLIDGDLELVTPDDRWVDDVLTSCTHPLTQLHAPLEAQITRDQLLQFISNAPLGREMKTTGGSKVPQYHFWMRVRDEFWGQPQCPPIQFVGAIGLRIGSTETIEMYYGHFGYHVYPAARGRQYAMRACRLLLPLARRHGFKTLWITCNPDNIASRRTCERLGAKLVEVVPVPEDNPLYARGEIQKCRYRFDLVARTKWRMRWW